MSLWPREDRGIPTETERVARAAFPKSTFCMRLRDVLGPLFTDEAFAGLFSGRGGRPNHRGCWRWSASCNSSRA